MQYLGDARRRAALLAASILVTASGGSFAEPGDSSKPASQPPMMRSLMAGQASERVLVVDPPRSIMPFTLVDQDGRAFRSEREMAGHVSLVFFGYSHCAAICPQTLQTLQQVLASDPAFDAVRVLMVSIDAERDTPAALKAFLAPFSPRIVGLTGTPEQVRPVARNFSASFRRQPASTPGGDYVVDHAAQVYLVDRSGRLTETFFNVPAEGVRDALRAALR